MGLLFGPKGRHTKRGNNPSLGLWKTIFDPNSPKGTGAVSGRTKTTVIGTGKAKKKRS